MSIQESAIAYHDNGFNCAQSVLAALQEETGLDESTAKRVRSSWRKTAARATAPI